MKKVTSTLLAALLALASQAQAHHVWIEQDAQNAKLYFGEFGENLRETSPGRLDKFVGPMAHKLSAHGAQPLEVVKTANGFSLAAPAVRGESLLAQESAYPITEHQDGDKTIRTLYVPAARLVMDYGRQEPRLALDLVPTGRHEQGSVEVQAFYQGKPLPKAKVEVITSAGWTQEHRADDQGKLTVSLPWQGSYVLEIKQADGMGQRDGERYDRANYVTSLTLMRTDGLPALPAAPAATPSTTK